MRQLEVTPNNIKFISNKQLVSRYNQIKRWISGTKSHLHPEVLSSLKKEQELIRLQLVERGAEDMIAEQLQLPGMEHPKKSAYEEIVIQQLISYYNKKIMLKRLEERLKHGVKIKIPIGISSYGNLSGVYGGSHEYQSNSERSIIQQEEKIEELRREIEQLYQEIEPVENALKILNFLERELIEKRFLCKDKPTDQQVIFQMPVQKTKYYELKSDALLKLAEALKIL